MTRKDQLSSNKDRCDICGAALDDDSLVQEFPDGSVVALCADCASEAAPENEMEDRRDPEPDDATVEWAGPHDDNPTAPAPPHFEAEIFAFEDLEPPERPAPEPEDEYEPPIDAAVKAEAELAAWASTSSEHPVIREDDSDPGEDYDEEELEEATLQLVAAIAEADMEDEERLHPEGDYEHVDVGDGEAERLEDGALEPVIESAPHIEAPAGEALSPEQPVSAPQVHKDEIIEHTKDLLVPVTDLISLQNEMQSALAKLSSTLEHFISDMAVSEQKTSAVNDRVQQLEDELESTRERLRVAESMLPDSSVGAAAAMAAATATKDAELMGDKPPTETPTAAVVPPPMPPPLPGSQSQSTPPPIPPAAAKTLTEAKAAAPTPPPLGLGAAAGAAAGAVGAAMVPPPLPGLATAAQALAGTAFSPPSLSPTTRPKLATPPPLATATTSATAASPAPPIGEPAMPAVSEPAMPPLASKTAPKKRLFKTSPADDEIDDDAGIDATFADELLIAPTPPLTPPAKTTTGPAPSVVKGAASGRADNEEPGGEESPAPETGSDSAPLITAGAAPEAALDAAPEPSSAGPVAGAAAAMQKFLRGRKGQTGPEPEPEPEQEPEPQEFAGLTFTINEVQVAQRHFNESEFVKKLREISRSIGKSQANVSRTSPGAPEAAITVFWDIVWYQYLVDLRKELPEGTKRVVLIQEGMDIAELEPRFREKNAVVDDQGRLDASELEVRLLSDPEALITDDDEIATPETRLAEDATEEIWDQRSAPEFRWD